MYRGVQRRTVKIALHEPAARDRGLLQRGVPEAAPFKGASRKFALFQIAPAEIHFLKGLIDMLNQNIVPLPRIELNPNKSSLPPVSTTDVSAFPRAAPLCSNTSQA